MHRKSDGAWQAENRRLSLQSVMAFVTMLMSTFIAKSKPQRKKLASKTVHHSSSDSAAH